jgi:hypothetical protein
MALQADGHSGFAARLGHAHPASYPFTLRYKEDVERLAKPAALKGTCGFVMQTSRNRLGFNGNRLPCGNILPLTARSQVVARIFLATMLWFRLVR